MAYISKPESLFDTRSQIIDNCEFITHKEDYIAIVLSKEPAGDFKAYATRASEASRCVLLASEPASDAYKAFESLLTKSCEATQQYINTNGFSLPPDIKRLGLDGDTDDDASSVASSVRSDALSDAYSSEDEDNQFSVPTSSCRPGKPGLGQAKPRRTKSENFHGFGKSVASRPSKPDVLLDGSIGQTKHKQVRHPSCSSRVKMVQPPSVGRLPPPGPRPISHMPPTLPPPPPATSLRVPVMPPPPHHPQLPQMQNAPQPPMPARPGGGPIPGAPVRPPAALFPGGPNGRLFDVRLTIRWAGHGEQRVLESLRPSIRALQDAALAYVRSHASSFDVGHVELPGYPYAHAVGQAAAKPWNLRATVRQAFFGNDAYDMTNYHGDDLTKLFGVLSVGAIPRFEIDVDQRPVSGSGVVS